MKKTLLFFLFSAAFITGFSQQNFWKAISNYQALSLTKGKQPFTGAFRPAAYRLFTLDEPSFGALIKRAPSENRVSASTSSLIILVPLADGAIEKFRLVEASVMQPKLQEKYSNIRSYAGQGVDQPSKKIRCDFTPLGFHATISSPDEQSIYINPANKSASLYAVYARSEKDKSGNIFKCDVNKSLSGAANKETGNITNANDGKLRTYRFAVPTGGEFSRLFLDGTETSDDEKKVKVVAALVTDLVRIDFINETDFNVRLQYVDNEDTIIFLDPKTDPFISNLFFGYFLGEWNTQSQKTIDQYIGSTNYDIGHLLMGFPAGGNAGCIGCVCNNPDKGSGVTGFVDDLTSDPFIVDFWAHEIGHQFGANHTFDYSNEGTIAQMEPGSASTIMGYAGTTGQYDIQPHSDPYFHAVSIQQIEEYIVNGKGNTCAVVLETNNNAPSVNAGADYIIPKSTPFKLTAQSSDADASDVLTYCWEQFDNYKNNGTSKKFPDDRATTGPQFRTYNPTLSTERLFPEINSILDGPNSNLWEVPSAVARELNFRITVRDNHPGGGSNNSDDMKVTVDGNSGPFKVTNPNTSINWKGGSTQTVQWDVANSNAAPVNCTNVNILLSIDRGQTFPYMLASNTPNDGTEEITVPAISESITLARVKIEAAQNIFFDISDKDFTVESALPVTWLSFSAERAGTNNALLKWSTANEYNNNHFEIERSKDGISFLKIATVAAGVNSNSTQNYSYTDAHLSVGKEYYRIKQVDNDGRFTYSKLAMIEITANGISWSIQPNPATENTIVVFNNNLSNTQIILNDVAGKVVYQKNLAAINSGYQLTIPLNNMAKGVYFIKVISDSGTQTQKLVIEK